MKRKHTKYLLLSLVLIFAMLFSVACSNNTDNKTTQTTQTNTEISNEEQEDVENNDSSTLEDSNKDEADDNDKVEDGNDIESATSGVDSDKSDNTEDSTVDVEDAINQEKEDSDKVEKPVEKPVVNFETVYAKQSVNVRKGPSTEYDRIGCLSYGESVKRIGKGDNGWSKVIYKEQEAYVSSAYLQTTKPAPSNNSSGSSISNYPLKYSDSTATITIYKEWFENAYCYAAHLQFSDYSRFGTTCGNGAYGGYETTSHAAKRLGAVFAVNGCYSAPKLNYPVARSGVVYNDKACSTPGVYSRWNGRFMSAWSDGGEEGIKGVQLSTLVNEGKVSDTFCFGPPFLINNTVKAGNDSSRAQRTFMGTNGNAGDIWIVVSDGRKNDGKSSGLTSSQCARYLQSKGCTFGIPLDGGGSSTMYFNGQVLNAAKNNQRAVVDFLYFK